MFECDQSGTKYFLPVLRWAVWTLEKYIQFPRLFPTCCCWEAQWWECPLQAIIKDNRRYYGALLGTDNGKRPIRVGGGVLWSAGTWWTGHSISFFASLFFTFFFWGGEVVLILFSVIFSQSNFTTFLLGFSFLLYIFFVISAGFFCYGNVTLKKPIHFH